MAVKRKKLTQREIKQNREIKKKMQAEGILPPDKPKLNRKKFAHEVCKEWKEQGSDCRFYLDIVLAMMTNTGRFGKVSQEDLGILKLKKCTMELKEAMEQNKEITYGEIIELLSPIWKL